MRWPAAFLLLASALTASGQSQPIAFSHKLHAGDYKLNCLFCHSSARRGAVAGLPSVEFCMGCHRQIAISKPEIGRLRGYWERQQPIRWTRVVKQPDFVYFSHLPHVQKGLRCQECHGKVETMTEMRLDHVLNMDRCVGCHRERKAPIDCYTCHR